MQQSAAIRDLWLVESRFDSSSFVVAASDPVCPHCGTTLCGAMELRRRADRILEAGPMLDFVRGLR